MDTIWDTAKNFQVLNGDAMQSNKQKIPMLIFIALTGVGVVLALFPFIAGYEGSNIYGYFALGGFVAMIGIIGAKVYYTRYTILGSMMKATPLLHWKFQLSENDREEGLPDEIYVAEDGMVWGGELYPFGAFQCSLVDFRIEHDPMPTLIVTYTSRDRVGRKRHHLSSPIPQDQIKAAENAANILIAKYHLEKRAYNKRKK